MSRDSTPGTRRARPRAWCVPPAILRDPADGLEGDRILAESPGDLGLLLWGAVRDVTLWSTTPCHARADLFSRGTAELRAALLAATEQPRQALGSIGTLLGMLDDNSNTDAEMLALCCLEVAAWANRTGLPHTAIAFAQAGALAAPMFGEAALQVGVHARSAGQTARADTWLRRAIAVSRRERNRVSYASALVELGALYENTGKLEMADRFYRRAFRAGRRFSARSARMRAAHGVFRLARLRKDNATAAQFALAAQRAFEADAAGAATLLLDLARFWTELEEPVRARAALRRTLLELETMEPAGQLASLALAARVRAQSGLPRSGSAAWRAAWVLLANQELPTDVRYRAAVDLAHAARSGGDHRSFRSARQVVLRLAPNEEFAAISKRMSELWAGEGEPAAPARIDK